MRTGNDIWEVRTDGQEGRSDVIYSAHYKGQKCKVRLQGNRNEALTNLIFVFKLLLRFQTFWSNALTSLVFRTHIWMFIKSSFESSCIDVLSGYLLIKMTISFLFSV